MKQAVILVAVVLVLFGAVACIDSCNRHKNTKPCFGNSQNR